MNKTYIILILLAIPLISNAGLFRDRARFNERAPGFWMKGRCVIPKNGLGLQDSSRVFKDLGCIVKIRKGKRRPKRERANVIIRQLYFGLTERSGREEWTIIENNNECTNVKRCNTKTFRFNVTEEVGVSIIGSRNCIIGWRGERRNRETARSFIRNVGRLPPVSHSLFSYRDFDRRCQEYFRI